MAIAPKRGPSGVAPKIYVKCKNGLFLHHLQLMHTHNVTSDGYKHKNFPLAPLAEFFKYPSHCQNGGAVHDCDS